jgi:seryl-tRNA synthetase
MSTSYTFAVEWDLSEQGEAFIRDAIERAYDVEDVAFGERKVTVQLRESITEADFNTLMERLDFVARKLPSKVLYENRPVREAQIDPLDELMRAGDVRRVGRGMFLFQGDFLALFRFFNDYWRDKALEMGAVEQENPALWPVDLYRKINYIAEFPHQILLGTGVKPKHADLEAMAEQYANDKSYESVSVGEHLDPSRFGLQNAVCDICYYALQGQRTFENTLFTTYNKVFRNECSETDSLDRLMSFSVRDIMFVGDEEYVMQWRQKMIDLSIEFLKWLDLDCRITAANDPFFTGDAMIKAVYQNASELKYELLVTLPFSGKELAIGSINLHQDFFGRAFDIQGADESYVWSGCLGIGFERLVYGIYAQYGTDTERWPPNLTEIIRKRHA